MNVVRFSALGTCRLYPAGHIPDTHLCLRLCRPQGYTWAGTSLSLKNPSDTIGNRTRLLRHAAQLQHCMQLILIRIIRLISYPLFTLGQIYKTIVVRGSSQNVLFLYCLTGNIYGLKQRLGCLSYFQQWSTRSEIQMSASRKNVFIKMEKCSAITFKSIVILAVIQKS
jgi:hypothetical protein